MSRCRQIGFFIKFTVRTIQPAIPRSKKIKREKTRSRIPGIRFQTFSGFLIRSNNRNIAYQFIPLVFSGNMELFGTESLQPTGVQTAISNAIRIRIIIASARFRLVLQVLFKPDLGSDLG